MRRRRACDAAPCDTSELEYGHAPIFPLGDERLSPPSLPVIHEELGALAELARVCGKSSIVMRENGEITIRGVKIDSQTDENTELRAKLIKLNC